MKRKNILSFIGCVLAAMFCFASCTPASGNNDMSSGVTSGSEGETERPKEYGTPTVTTEFTSSAPVEGTTHIYNKTKTSSYVMQNGGTNYKILLPQDSNSYEEYAAQELQYFFNEATGCTLAIVNEQEGGVYTNGNYISLGATSIQQATGVSFDYATLGYGGFKIVTYGNSIVASGAQKFGTLYATYELLHQMINWETYSADCIVYDTNVTEIPLYNYEIIDVPDIAWRQMDYLTVVSQTPALMKRLRFNDASEIFAFPSGWCHNTFHMLPPATYLKEHKNWYSHNKWGETIYSPNPGEEHLPSQICYTNDDAEMFEIIVDGLIQWLEDSPDVEIVCFSQEDNRGWCECNTCAASYNQYGTNAAALIKYINKIYVALEPWIKESGREITLSFFAYHRTVDAPAKLEGDKYVPIDDSVKCLENVAVMYAPIEADYSKPLTHESNTVENENLKKWQALSEKMLLWTYSADYYSYLSPYNTFNSMQENYKIAVRSGATWLFDQQQKGAQNSTGFQILKYYLQSKLSWNVNLDINELIDNFLENYFGPAADTMTTLLNEVRTRMAYIENELNVPMYVYVVLENTNYWPKGLLQQWLGYIDQAYKEIETVKNVDEELYKMLYDRIMLESISYRWLLINLYGENVFDAETLLKEKLAFKSDCAYLKVTNYREAWVPNLNDYLLINWGV